MRSAGLPDGLLSQAKTLLSGASRDLCSDGGGGTDDRFPVAVRTLVEQFEVRIPGCFCTIHRPAEVGLKGQHDDGRPSGGTGNMRQAGIDGHNGVCDGADRRRICQVGIFVQRPCQVRCRFDQAGFIVGEFVMQTDPFHIAIKQANEIAKVNPAPAVIAVLGIAAPGNCHARLCAGPESICPVVHEFRLYRQIGGVARYGFRNRPEGQWQAHHWTMKIPVRGLVARSKQLGDTVERLKQGGLPTAGPGSLDLGVSDAVELELGLRAFLPQGWVASSDERLELLRQLDGIGAPHEADDVLADLRDRYGRVPREALDLVDRRGFSPTEAAEQLGVAPSTVRALLHQGRRALRETLLDDPEIASLVRDR